MLGLAVFRPQPTPIPTLVRREFQNLAPHTGKPGTRNTVSVALLASINFLTLNERNQRLSSLRTDLQNKLATFLRREHKPRIPTIDVAPARPGE